MLQTGAPPLLLLRAEPMARPLTAQSTCAGAGSAGVAVSVAAGAGVAGAAGLASAVVAVAGAIGLAGVVDVVSAGDTGIGAGAGADVLSIIGCCCYISFTRDTVPNKQKIRRGNISNSSINLNYFELCCVCSLLFTTLLVLNLKIDCM